MWFNDVFGFIGVMVIILSYAGFMYFIFRETRPEIEQEANVYQFPIYLDGIWSRQLLGIAGDEIHMSKTVAIQIRCGRPMERVDYQVAQRLLRIHLIHEPAAGAIPTYEAEMVLGKSNVDPKGLWLVYNPLYRWSEIVNLYGELVGTPNLEQIEQLVRAIDECETLGAMSQL